MIDLSCDTPVTGDTTIEVGGGCMCLPKEREWWQGWTQVQSTHREERRGEKRGGGWKRDAMRCFGSVDDTATTPAADWWNP